MNRVISKSARAISKILFIMGSYKFLAYLECVRIYAWSCGHSDPDLSSVDCLFLLLSFFLFLQNPGGQMTKKVHIRGENAIPRLPFKRMTNRIWSIELNTNFRLKYQFQLFFTFLQVMDLIFQSKFFASRHVRSAIEVKLNQLQCFRS